MKGKNLKEFIEALEMLEREKGIKKAQMVETIRAAIQAAYRKNNGEESEGIVEIDEESGDMRLYVEKTVVAIVEDTNTQIALEEAQSIRKSYKLGQIIKVEIDCGGFKRTAIQNAKQIIIQKVREVEKENTFNKLKESEDKLVNGMIRRIDDNNNAYIELNGVEVFLAASEQLPTDQLYVGDRVKVYVSNVQESTKFPKVLISRKNEGFLRKLFEQEIPEISEGFVEIKSIAREAGSRSKVAIYAADENIDLIGVCIGNRGVRIKNILDEIGDEKIDLIVYSSDVKEYVQNALNPAKVEHIDMLEEKMSRVYVPQEQFSLAIGKSGQNARLAARLTGIKIDIKIME
ncbi:MAG: transcription termination factor NusA [Fusobacteria bacterium]|nr:transcription termination factor NusA [Fusobacteriota bacterium]